MRVMTWRSPLIAVVDDEESVRCAFARMLSASMFDVETYGSGREFLDSLREHVPDCVVLDLQMPGLTGREVQLQLAMARICLPMIVVTAQDQPTVREQCLADGAAAFVAKPLKREHLVRLIDDAIGVRATVS
jgi:FixJ family two-component response regulator